jgi:uridylate kinase
MRIVIRVGGSVVASPINTELISKYVDLLGNLRTQEYELIVVVGGGALARDFIKIAKDLGLEEKAQDELAISVSRLFAQLFLKRLGDAGCKMVPSTIEDASGCLAEGKVVVMGGLKPGITTDTVAALVAEYVRADLLVKATDQNGVYDKDPRRHPDAVKLDNLGFDDLSHVFDESKHKAGIHQIIDPEAAKILRRCRIKVVVVGGFVPENVLDAIKGKSVGTLIS